MRQNQEIEIMQRKCVMLAARVPLLLGAVLLLCGAGLGAFERSAFGGLLRYTVPTGWSEDRNSVLSGPNSIEFSRDGRAGDLRMSIELMQGAPADSEEVAGLMKAPWDSAVAQPAQRVGEVLISGVKTTLWHRDATPGYREEPGQSVRYSTDEFCTVPLGGRFLLLVFSKTKNDPGDFDLSAQDAWRSLLGSIRTSRPGSRAQGAPQQ